MGPQPQNRAPPPALLPGRWKQGSQSSRRGRREDGASDRRDHAHRGLATPRADGAGSRRQGPAAPLAAGAADRGGECVFHGGLLRAAVTLALA